MNPDPRFSHRVTNGVRLHVAEAGPEDGPLLILLHGFPEFWYGWRHQIGPLAAAGYRVLAPDQRGYNLSDKPGQVADYALDTLAADVIGLIDAEGRDRARLVGHDWGGVVAWWVAANAPGRLEKVAILNAPHPRVFRRHLLRSPVQLLRSWYVLAFQLPRLPELALSRRDWSALARSLRQTSRPGTFGEADLRRYREAWSQPGAIRCMIHWYRAAMRYPTRRNGSPVDVPTLLVWGANDRFLDRSLARPSLDQCRDGRLEMVETATHWLHHEEPGRINDLLLSFLGSY